MRQGLELGVIVAFCFPALPSGESQRCGDCIINGSADLEPRLLDRACADAEEAGNYRLRTLRQAVRDAPQRCLSGWFGDDRNDFGLKVLLESVDRCKCRQPANGV